LGTNLGARAARALDSILLQSPARSSARDCLRLLRLNIHSFLEKQGAYLVTCANLFQLSGFVCEDVLYLQSLMIFGNGSMALYFLTRMPPLGVAFAWALLKTLVNIFMVFKILHSRQPVALTLQELIAYEEHFMPFGLTAREFKKVWDLGEFRQYQPQDLLIEQGKPVECLSLVLYGYVYRTAYGKHIACLDTFPGARTGPEGDAGAWVGATNALQRLETVKDITLLKSSCTLRDTDGKDDTAAIARSASGKWKVLFYGKGADTERLNSSNEVEVMNLQNTLAALGFYSGSQDGFAGPKTQRALKKLEASCRVALDGVDGEQANQAMERLEQRMVAMHNARMSVHAGEAVIVRVWEMEPLLNLCKSNAEIAGTLRKVLSQSVIKTALVLHPCKPTDMASEHEEKSPLEHHRLSAGTPRCPSFHAKNDQPPEWQQPLRHNGAAARV